MWDVTGVVEIPTGIIEVVTNSQILICRDFRIIHDERDTIRSGVQLFARKMTLNR